MYVDYLKHRDSFTWDISNFKWNKKLKYNCKDKK